MLLGVLLAALACAGCGSDGAQQHARVDRFDGTRAFAELRREVELGPRPAGSPVLRKLAVRLKHALPRGHFEAVPGHPGLRNIVGRIPGKKPAVVVAAHYDTKDLPGFVGANDGAGGTAAVLELARALRHTKRPKGAPELRFVLFDGEEATDDDRDFLATGRARLEGLRAPPRRRAARAGPARLRGRQGPEHPARGRLGREAVGAAAAGRQARRGRAARSRTSCAARSPTTTRRSPPAACPRST